MNKKIDFSDKDFSDKEKLKGLKELQKDYKKEFGKDLSLEELDEMVENQCNLFMAVFNKNVL
jgi:hypothetical protein